MKHVFLFCMKARKRKKQHGRDAAGMDAGKYVVLHMHTHTLYEGNEVVAHPCNIHRCGGRMTVATVTPCAYIFIAFSAHNVVNSCSRTVYHFTVVLKTGYKYIEYSTHSPSCCWLNLHGKQVWYETSYVRICPPLTKTKQTLISSLLPDMF